MRLLIGKTDPLILESTVPEEVASLTDEDLQRRANEPGKIHFCVHLGRPGARLFGVYLEYTHFAPRTSRNIDFEMTIVKWPKKPIQLNWVVFTIPAVSMNCAEAAAKASGLVIKESIPVIFGGGEPQRFPMESHSVYSLESNPASRVYEGKSDEIEAAETKEIQRTFQEDVRKHREELRQQGMPEAEIDALFREIHE